MKIIIDKNIPYIQGALEAVADIEYLTYREMNPDTVRDADALIIRTRTKCNQSLLEGSRVKFIATATIGYDHIDTGYCAENGIVWKNAPGCNSLSVAQYLASVLCLLSKERNCDLNTKTIGIVGVGNVGTKIEKLAKAFGMKVLLNDPPRARLEGNENFVTLNEIALKADIITFHPLLNKEGIDKTYHLADEIFFRSLKRKPIIINASRGEVVKAEALRRALKDGFVSEVVLDCWENEPTIDLELLHDTFISTPHIAGYSADGKANATTQSVQSVSKFFRLGLDNWQPAELPKGFDIDLRNESIADFFLKTYDITADSSLLKSSPETFERQRSNYPVRREPKAYTENCPDEIEERFGFFF
ncbi:MAG: 4-phosphoerythronate dehydrogenase PdxB [Paludibacteraceae bacterium]